jgi:WD40 repeat protein
MFISTKPCSRWRIGGKSTDHISKRHGRSAAQPLATLQGHTDRVTGAVFAPDGGRILTASYDETARLWDRDGQPLAILQGHTGSVFSAVFAPDGGRILTASDDKTARPWDRDGKLVATLQGHTDQVTSVVFAPDGGRIRNRAKRRTGILRDEIILAK